MVGFDSVDDESKPEYKFMKKHEAPSEWTSERNPPYSYWSFYLAMNIRSLNALRHARGMNVFAYRPHAGEAGDVDHLESAFMLAKHINHGITLKHAPVLQVIL